MARTPEQQSIIDFLNVNANQRLAKLQAAAHELGMQRLDSELGIAIAEINEQIRLLELQFPVPTVPDIDTWNWPVVGGVQQISVVNGEVQNSAAHALRGVPPAVDLPGYLGQPLQPLVPGDPIQSGYDDENGHWLLWQWTGRRGVWRARYSHLVGAHVLQMGQSGNADGPHTHLTIWLNGERVMPEGQEEFVALLTGP